MFGQKCTDDRYYSSPLWLDYSLVSREGKVHQLLNMTTTQKHLYTTLRQTALSKTVLQCTVLQCTALQCSVLQWTVLFLIALQCRVVHCPRRPEPVQPLCTVISEDRPCTAGFTLSTLNSQTSPVQTVSCRPSRLQTTPPVVSLYTGPQDCDHFTTAWGVLASQPHRRLMHCKTLHWTIMHCSVQCTALHSTTLHWTSALQHYIQITISP